MHLSNSQSFIIMNYVPLMISPHSFMPKSKWELLPGIWLEKIPKKIKQKIEEVDSRIFPKLNFQPNFAVSIENSKYINELKDRIADEGRDLPEIRAGVDLIQLDAKNLAKLFIISLIMQKNFSFILGYTYNFAKSYSKSNKVIYSYHSVHIGVAEDTSRILTGLLPQRKATRINRKTLIRTIRLLERYFRPYTWQIDRLSVALENFWSALTAKNICQSFLSLTIMIESLLSTSKFEISHTVSERAAIILGKNADQRIEIYRDFKKIYNQRSKIVHGEGVPKKGSLNLDSFIISTHFSIVPQKWAEKLFKYSFQLLSAIFNEPKLITIIQCNKKERKINEELNGYYLSMLMGKKR